MIMKMLMTMLMVVLLLCRYHDDRMGPGDEIIVPTIMVPVTITIVIRMLTAMIITDCIPVTMIRSG